MSDHSPTTTNEKSDLDIVRLMEANCLSNSSPQTSLKQRVQVDDIGIISFEPESIVNSNLRNLLCLLFYMELQLNMMLILNGILLKNWKQFRVALETSVYKWRPIFQQIGVCMAYCQQKEQYISLR